jgi:hypothetical protein
MKNCLVVLLVLIGCFAIAVYFVLFVPHGGSARASGRPYMIATWRDYGDPGADGVEVTVGTDQILVDVPAMPQFRRFTEKGRWSGHTFYCDSHLDAPPEIAVARELPNEDLEVDIGHFLPDQTGTITCVKVMRIDDDDERPPYPVNEPGQTVSYPPPKGLIHPGTLECDLQMLPWHADSIVAAPIVVEVNTTVLSDGTPGKSYFPPFGEAHDPRPPETYIYHSDRPGLPKLLVTVYHGRVTKVTGGAEESDDFPYQFPNHPQPPPASP